VAKIEASFDKIERGLAESAGITYIELVVRYVLKYLLN
jgi:hypothetical protein